MPPSRPPCASRCAKLIGRHEDVGQGDERPAAPAGWLRIRPCHPALPVAVEPDDVEVGDEDVEAGGEELPQEGHLDKAHLEEVEF